MNYWYLPIIAIGLWLAIMAFIVLYFDTIYWKNFVSNYNYNSYIEGYFSHLPDDDFKKIQELDLTDKSSYYFSCACNYVVYSNADKKIVLTLFRYSVGLVFKSYIYSLQYTDTSYPISCKSQNGRIWGRKIKHYFG